MKTYTYEQALAKFATLILSDNTETDNQGQMIAYSGLFKWSDGTYRDQEENEVPEGFAGRDSQRVHDTVPADDAEFGEVEGCSSCKCDTDTTECLVHAQAPEEGPIDNTLPDIANVEALKEQMPYISVRGIPGSGKSTFKAADPVLEEQVDTILSSIPPCEPYSPPCIGSSIPSPINLDDDQHYHVAPCADDRCETNGGTHPHPEDE